MTNPLLMQSGVNAFNNPFTDTVFADALKPIGENFFNPEWRTKAREAIKNNDIM